MSKDLHYDNIDWRSNLLYNFINKKADCADFRFKLAEDIELIDIKELDDFNFKHVFDGKFAFMFQHERGAVFKRSGHGKHAGKDMIVYVGKYQGENENYKEMKRSEMSNIKMAYLLTEVSIHDDMDFILSSISNFDIFPKDTNKIIKSKIKNGVHFCQIFEGFHPITTLDKILPKLKIGEIRVILFQILYALYRIGAKYPAFRHNKLHPKNIFVYKAKGKKGKLTVGDHSYNLPDVGLHIRLANFWESNIKGTVNNSNTNKTMANLYYDMHYLLHSIYSDDNKYDQELVNFIESVIPENYRYDEFTGLDEVRFMAEADVDSMLTPMIVLQKNNFFQGFNIERK